MYVRLCCARFKQLPPIVLFFPYTTLFRSTRRGFTYSAHLGARRFALESDANRTARGAHSTRNQRTARDDLDTAISRSSERSLGFACATRVQRNLGSSIFPNSMG